MNNPLLTLVILYTITLILFLYLPAVKTMKNSNENNQATDERTSLIQQIIFPLKTLRRKVSFGRSSTSSSASSSPSSSIFKYKCGHTDVLLPLTPKNAKCRCNSYVMRDMTKISFYSSIGNGNNSVKVSLHKPINSGSQAQVYHGCYYDPSSKENKCVAVKLLGTGTRKTQYNTQDTVKKQKKLFKSLSSKDNTQLSLKDLLLKEEIEKNIKSEEKSRSKMLEGIVEDSMNEIGLLKKFQEKFENQKSPKHIIGMYDGGSIIKIHGDRDEEQIYSYIIIMELGTETFQDKMISIAKNYIEKDEEKLMHTLMDPAHVLSRIHQVAIHMDFKPKNMVYVPSQNGDILKAIDFGGSLLLNGQRPSMWNDKICIKSKLNNPKICKRTLSLPANVEGNINIKNKTNVEQKNNIVEKITCTRQYLPPELDNRYLIEQSNLNNIAIKKLNASTKSDVWMFGIMCCELFLYIKYISIEKNIECLKKTINKKLLRINDLYKWKKELLEQDKLNKIENYNKISNSLGINDENIEVHRTSTSQHDPYSLQPSISDLQNEINDMLELKRDYPRYFQLITYLLQLAPERRLSAIGILGFLSGKCRINYLNSDLFFEDYTKKHVATSKSLLEQVFYLDVEFNDLLHHDNSIEICDYGETVDNGYKKSGSFKLFKNINEVKAEKEFVEENMLSTKRVTNF